MNKMMNGSLPSSRLSREYFEIMIAMKRQKLYFGGQKMYFAILKGVELST